MSSILNFAATEVALASQLLADPATPETITLVKDPVGALWGTFGGLIATGIFLYIVFTFFVGSSKDIPKGILYTVVTGAILVLALNYSVILGFGEWLISQLFGGMGTLEIPAQK